MSAKIDLWVLRLGDVSEDLADGLLTPNEKHKALGFLKPEDRARARQGRSALRLALGQRLDRDPASLRFDQPPGHRPVLSGEECAPGFSVSHSGSLILIALADGPVGVDAEKWRPSDWKELAERFFHDRESQWLRALSPEHEAEGFFRLWTMKEAYLKGLGLGLSRQLDSFCVPPVGGAVNDPGQGAGWHVKPLEIAEGYAAALAAKARLIEPVWRRPAELLTSVDPSLR